MSPDMQDGWAGPELRSSTTGAPPAPAQWLLTIRAAQWGLVLASALLIAVPAFNRYTTLLALLSAGVVLLAAATFAGTALTTSSRRSLAAAWALLAVSAAAVSAVVASTPAQLAAGGIGSGRGGESWGAAGALAVAALVQAAGIWLMLLGRAPRWAPSTGWDGPVVALGAAAVGAGALELSWLAARRSGDMTRPATVLATCGATLFVVALTAVAVSAPGPRPQLRWLAGGLTLLVATDLVSLATHDAPALLVDLDGTDSRLLRLAAVTGYAVLALATTAGPAGRGPDRRLRQSSQQSEPVLAAALVTASAAVVLAAVVDPGAPRAAAVLALACLGIALIRTRRTLRDVQFRGRNDPRPRTDDLTGLANRRALSEALAGDTRPDGIDGDNSGWSGWAGWADEIALLLVDLDRFKDVNEALGHDAGDLLLAEVGARLRTALRPTQLLARLGGDEFAVVLPAADTQTARRVAQALRESLSEPFEIEGSRLHVQASVGVATCTPTRGEPTDLLRQADVAMYQAKALGTGIEVYDPARDSDGGERLRRTDELREALERGDLEVHVQPQVDLRTGLICGGEALARWRHPLEGVLLPDSFLPLAEHTGLMKPVAALLLDRALEACATWWSPDCQVPISVNLGADDLRDPDLPERVTKLLHRHGLPTDALRVEITEQALLTDLPATAGVLARWRADGIAVSIDDFGTGYSSLSYLRELPVDEVKLDQAFIADIRRPTTMTIVRHTVAMAHGLWARTVAEGIEDEATARIVADLGCDVGQGLYFGGAMTPPEFAERARR
jgi:diguanylate cyclase